MLNFLKNFQTKELTESDYMALANHLAEHCLKDLKNLNTPISKNHLIGARMSKRKGSGHQFWQFREYMPDNSRKDIDWRQSAKSDNLIVKEREQEIKHHYLFWLDPSKTLNFRSSKRYLTKKSYAIVLILSLFKLIQNQEDSANLIGTSDATPHSTNQMLDILHVLQNDNFVHMDKIQSENIAIQNNKTHTPLLFSDFWANDSDTLSKIEHIMSQYKTGYLCAVHDPAELSFSYNGHLVFTELETEKDQHIVKNAESLKHDFIKKVEEHCHLMSETAARYNWTWRSVSTNAPLEQSLDTLIGLEST